VSHAGGGARAVEVRYIVQPRGPGTAYQFRIRTPSALVGMIDPETGKPFGATIKRGTGESHLPTARKIRDRLLGSIRAAEDAIVGGRSPVSAVVAGRWRDAIAAGMSRSMLKLER